MPLERPSDGRSVSFGDTGAPRVLLFTLEGRAFALPASKVAGLADCGPPRPIPGTPAAVLGLVEWRGSVLTALDLPALLGVKAGAGPSCFVRLARPLHRVALFVPATLQMCELGDDALGHGPRRVIEIDPGGLIREVESLLPGPA